MTVKHLVDIGNQSFYVEILKNKGKYDSFRLASRELARDQPQSPSERMKFRNLYIIDSIKSGTGRTANNDIYNIIIKPILQKMKIEFTYYRTDSCDSIEKFAKTFDTKNSNTLMFISGDTSISEFLNNMTITNDPHSISQLNVLPIPMGTANALANSLNYFCPIEVLSNWLNETCIAKPLPLYKAIFPDNTSVIFFIILSLGFHANLLHACEAPEYKEMGVERFQVASSRILRDYDLNLKIKMQDNTESYSYFALINVPRLEENYLPSPLSDTSKEQLHLLAYKSFLDNDSLVAHIMQGYSNKIADDLTSNGIVYRPINSDFSLTLDIPKSSPKYKYEVCCDGMLFNLLDMDSNLSKYNNMIRVEYLDYKIDSVKINVLTKI